MLPAPARLDAALRAWPTWRQDQAEAVWSLLDDDAEGKRHSCLVAPTGFGKSLVYVVYHTLASREARKDGTTQTQTVILTSTKSLQTQITRDFARLSPRDVRGQQNYPCTVSPHYTVDLGDCHVGVPCDFRQGTPGCPYYDAVRAAKYAPLVTTNYAYWLVKSLQRDEWVLPTRLILDEAHAAPEELASALRVMLYHSDWHRGGVLADYGRPLPGETWYEWARRVRPEIERRSERMRLMRGGMSRHLARSLRRLSQSLGLLETGSPTTWVMEKQHSALVFEPIDTRQYLRVLTGSAERVVFVSATVRRKTMGLLGVPEEELAYREYESSFPAARRPVIHVPTVRLSHRSTPDELRLWLARIDQIITRRLDRKGLVHCVSYARRDYLLRNSSHRGIMLTHDSGQQAEAVSQFLAAQAPAVLVSPSATTGLDLPYRSCEYSIIAKLPWPDSRSPVMAARTALDADYPAYLTAQEIVQAAGRGMRAADDRHEVLVVDDHWQWFARKYREYLPVWFRVAMQWAASVPEPPPALG
jgi:Rad3-related DNA helicase